VEPGEIKTVLTLDDKSIETEFIVIHKAFKSRSIIGLPILKQLKLIKNIDLITTNELNKDKFVEMNLGSTTFHPVNNIRR